VRADVASAAKLSKELMMIIKGGGYLAMQIFSVDET
jgi:hypothetical protein